MASKKKKAKRTYRKKTTLQAASTSSDPVVHKLLADRQTAVMNQELLSIEDIDKQLAEFGLYA